MSTSNGIKCSRLVDKRTEIIWKSTRWKSGNRFILMLKLFQYLNTRLSNTHARKYTRTPQTHAETFLFWIFFGILFVSKSPAACDIDFLKFFPLCGRWDSESKSKCFWALTLSLAPNGILWGRSYEGLWFQHTSAFATIHIPLHGYGSVKSYFMDIFLSRLISWIFFCQISFHKCVSVQSHFMNRFLSNIISWTRFCQI